jgi:hypothetical protein
MKDFVVTEKAGRIVANRVNNGVGTTLTMTEEEAALAVEAGELIPVSEPQAEDAEQAAARDLAKLTKAELLGLAGELGVEADEKQTKAEIIAAIEAHKAKAAEA